MLQKFTDQPHKHTIPVFGAIIQDEKAVETSNKLDDDSKKFIKQVTGTYLYYARAVEPKMMISLSEISSNQEALTEETIYKAKYFLGYAESHPDVILSYSASDMVLAAHIDALYLTKPKARSRAGGNFFMSNNTAKSANNGAVLTIAQIIKNVTTSAADA